MSFDVHLIQSSDTPNGAEFSRRFEAVMGEMNGKLIHDELVEMADGSSVEMYGAKPDEDQGSAMFAVRDFTPAIFGMIYRVADANSSFIHTGEKIFRTPANRGAFPDADPSFLIIDVADEQAFLGCIVGEFGKWSDYRDQVVSSYEPAPPTPEHKPKSLFSRLFGGGKT